MADEIGQVAITDGIKAFEADRVVEACDEVVRRIDERTVEIEDNERSGHGGNLAGDREDGLSGMR
jgi:hypothetical protein